MCINLSNIVAGHSQSDEVWVVEGAEDRAEDFEGRTEQAKSHLSNLLTWRSLLYRLAVTPKNPVVVLRGFAGMNAKSTACRGGMKIGGNRRPIDVRGRGG